MGAVKEAVGRFLEGLGAKLVRPEAHGAARPREEVDEFGDEWWDEPVEPPRLTDEARRMLQAAEPEPVAPGPKVAEAPLTGSLRDRLARAKQEMG